MSMPTPIERGPLWDVPEQMAAELNRKSFFQSLSVEASDPKDIDDEFEAQIAAVKGVRVLVEPPAGTNSKPGIFGALDFDNVSVAVSVWEDAKLNRSPDGTGLHGLRVLFEAMAALHGYRPPGARQMLACVSFDPVDDPTLVVWRAVFRTGLSLRTNADLVERRPV